MDALLMGVRCMDVEKLRNGGCLTHRKSEEGVSSNPRVIESRTLRARDVLGVERAAAITVPSYAERTPVPIPLRSFAPEPPRSRKRRFRPALREQFSEDERERLRALDVAVAQACAV